MAEEYLIWLRVFFADTNRRGLTGSIDLLSLRERINREVAVDDVVAHLSHECSDVVGGIANFDYQAFVTMTTDGDKEPESVEANCYLTGRYGRFTSLKIVSKMKDPLVARDDLTLREQQEYARVTRQFLRGRPIDFDVPEDAVNPWDKD